MRLSFETELGRLYCTDFFVIVVTRQHLSERYVVSKVDEQYCNILHGCCTVTESVNIDRLQH
jgi:hypothetical protein